MPVKSALGDGAKRKWTLLLKLPMLRISGDMSPLRHTSSRSVQGQLCFLSLPEHLDM
jgi:hypothetical protein